MVFWDAVPHIVADVYNQIHSNGDIWGVIKKYGECLNKKKLLQ